MGAVLQALVCLAVTSASPEPPHVDLALLTLRIDGVDKGEILAVVRAEGTLLDSATLKEAGVRLGDQPTEVIQGHHFVNLSSLAPNIVGHLDTDELVVDLTVKPELLPRTTVSLRAGRPPDLVYRQDTSGFLNYSLQLRDVRDASGFFEAGVGVAGNLLYSSLSWPFTQEEGVPARSPVRGLSYLEINGRDTLQRLTVGDALATTGPLGGGALLGGLTFAKSYDLDPYFVRYPMFEASGAALAPSTVYVYVNGRLVRQEAIRPGLFRLEGVPATTGGGDIRYVIRDAFGHTTSISSTYYLSPASLAPGIQDYAYSLGVRREKIGVASFDYGQPALMARHYVGVTNWLTIGARLEAALDLLSGGFDATFVSPVGQLELSGASSGSHDLSGLAGLAGWSYSGRLLGANLLVRGATRHYATISTAVGDDRALAEVLGGVSVPIGVLGSVSVNGGLSRLRDAGVSGRLALGLSARLSGEMSLLATGTMLWPLQGERSSEIAASLVFALPGQHTEMLGWRQAPERGISQHAEATASLEKPLPYGSGLGYRLQDTVNDQGQAYNGIVEYQGRYGRGSAEVIGFNDHPVPILGLAGGVAAVRGGGGLYLGRPIENAFGVVRVPDVKGAEVFLNNQKMGQTNADGEILIPNLLPYQANRLSVADSGIPLDRSIQSVERSVAPPRRSGVLVEFSAERTNFIRGTVVAVGAAGTSVPAYGELMVQAGIRVVTSPIGKGGEFELEGLPPGDYPATVTWSEGRCHTKVRIPVSATLITELGEIRCVLEEEHSAP